ncbi:hypothetical protein GOP47_0026142 [Adiantum capillus-veneris]|uniref:Uncharacterized protein n=1 Tax=Adiantum capillus-veneris TaxID=13818 RepID=A0A9D4U2J4_ADICA|nr:hypothetical protein GOP47_0026142 [Adiantum capillus-veneris]
MRIPITPLQNIVNAYVAGKHAPQLLCTTVGQKDRPQKMLDDGSYWDKAIEGADGKDEENVAVHLQAAALHKVAPPGSLDISSGLRLSIATIGQHKDQVLALAVAGDLLYSASASTDIRVFKAPFFQELDRFGSGNGMVKALMTFGGKLYSAHQDNKIRVWKRVGNGDTPCKHKLQAVLPRLDHVLKSMLSNRKYVQVRRHKKKLWMEHADTISALAMGGRTWQGNIVHGNGHESCTPSVLYSASWDKTVKVWSLNSYKCIESFYAHNDAINAMIVVDGSVLVTASADCSIKLWLRREFSVKKTKHSLLTTLHGQRAAVNALAVSANGKILYSGGSDGAMIAWKRVYNKPQARVSFSYNSIDHSRSVSGDQGLKGGEGKEESSTANDLSKHESGSLAGLRRVSRHNRAVASGVSFVMRKVIMGHTRAVLSVSTVGNNIVCSSSADKTIRIWRRTANKYRPERRRSGDYGTPGRPTQRRSGDYGPGAALHETVETSVWEYTCLAVLAGHEGPVKSIVSVLCPASDYAINIAGDGDCAHHDTGVVVYSGGLDSKVNVWSIPLHR